MARKKTVLLMTVGTGIGKPERVKENLAHGLLFSVESHNPDFVFLFGSQDSKETVEYMKKQYKEQNEDEFDYYEFIQIDKYDDFNEYFGGISSKIKELNEEYKIIIDYTSGTKTMTMSAAFASMVFRKTLSLVAGDRKEGLVVPGTERIITQNLYPVYDNLMMDKVKELFNTNRFESGQILLNEMIGDDPDKEIYSKLFDIYKNFDIFDYETSLSLFDETFLNVIREKWPDLAQNFSNNRKALKSMQKIDSDKIDLGKKPWKNKKYKKRCYYILANLLNNAERRKIEHKYDDAIARLYRALEFVAQIELKTKYGISTSNVDCDILSNRNIDEKYIGELERNRDELSDKIKIGLVQDYLLLNELGNDLGHFFKENMGDILKCNDFRNKSILAHGLNYQTNENYRQFAKFVFTASNILNPKINVFREESRFPKFN